MSVTLTQIVKSFDGKRAVDGVTAAVETGEFFAVVGPSGCGKSTVLRLIAGLETLDGGEIAMGGVVMSADGRHAPPEARRTGFVFQSYALWPHMNVRDNVAFAAEADGRGRKAARQAADGHLATVALSAYADRKPAALSGGQRQRVALARCLAGGAETILMDEPLANLDPHLRAAMEEELTRFHRTAGVTTIYITHDQREAMALADRIAVMFEGRLHQIGAPREIYERPVNEAVARFIGRGAVLDVVVRDGRARFGPFSGETGAKDGSARILLRPSDIQLGAPDAPGAVAAVLTDALYRGGHWEAAATVDGLSEALPVASAAPLGEGERIGLFASGGWVLPEG